VEHERQRAGARLLRRNRGIERQADPPRAERQLGRSEVERTTADGFGC
jgi:hypothetical protein